MYLTFRKIGIIKNKNINISTFVKYTKEVITIFNRTIWVQFTGNFSNISGRLKFKPYKNNQLISISGITINGE